MLEEEYNPRRRLPPHLRPAPPEDPEFAFEIRPAAERDLPDLLEIYNHYVANSTVTFDEEPLALRDLRERFAAAGRLGHPWLVAETPSRQIIGYASVAPWKQKAAYRHTVEDSIYLGPAATGKGLGGALLGALVDASRDAGITEMIAVIADRGAEASIRIHERHGFETIGHMGRVGYKFGRYLGTVLMQLSLRRKRR